MTRARRSQAGFTPLEVLVATGVGLAAIAAFSTFFVAQMHTMRVQAVHADLQGTARGIVDLFARDVRRAGSGTNVACTGTVSTGVVSAGFSSVRIRADLDANGALTGPNEDVTYTLDWLNGRVNRTDHNGNGSGVSRTDTLWSQSGLLGLIALSGSSLTYYDGAGNQVAPGWSGLGAADLLQIRRVKLELALRVKAPQPRTNDTLTVRESADVELRNRYFIMPAQCAFN